MLPRPPLFASAVGQPGSVRELTASTGVSGLQGVEVANPEKCCFTGTCAASSCDAQCCPGIGADGSCGPCKPGYRQSGPVASLSAIAAGAPAVRGAAASSYTLWLVLLALLVAAALVYYFFVVRRRR